MSELDDFDWEASEQRDDAYEEANPIRWDDRIDGDCWLLEMKYYNGGGPSERYAAHTTTLYWDSEDAEEDAVDEVTALGPGRKAEYRVSKVRITTLP